MLCDEAPQAALDPVGVGVIAEADRRLVKERHPPTDLEQQKGAGMGSDGTAVKSRHHAAAVALKLQRFDVTLGGLRFCSWNLFKFFYVDVSKDTDRRDTVRNFERVHIRTIPLQFKRVSTGL